MKKQRKITAAVLVLLLFLSAINFSGAEGNVTYQFLETETEVDISILHGIKLCMTKEEVFNIETAAGNQFLTGPSDEDTVIASVSEMENKVYMKTKVAGIDDTWVCLLFRNDIGTLYCVTYDFPYSTPFPTIYGKKKDYDAMEEGYQKKYGDPYSSNLKRNYWGGSKDIKVTYGSNQSGFNSLPPEYYTQRVAKGSDGSRILIEHSLAESSSIKNGLVVKNHVVYMYYDPESVQAEYHQRNIQNRKKEEESTSGI